jgi:hypothetical protein
VSLAQELVDLNGADKVVTHQGDPKEQSNAPLCGPTQKSERILNFKYGSKSSKSSRIT